MHLFNKILVANRGEIAVRIIKAAQKLGILTVGIYAPDDTDSLHLEYADEIYKLEGNILSETYLNIEQIISIALKTGVEAIHPGYGFLAENPDFVKACENNNIVFIGPDAEAMRLMGNKVEARNFALKNNIPIIQGITGSIEEILKKSDTLEFPVLIKAAAGGGGKGMRVVYEPQKLAEEIEATAREAKNYFGDSTVFVEKYIENPRHIEAQILADKYGNIVHLFERECTIQRRHQKIIEEAPSPTLDEKTREQLLKTAVKIAKSINYTNAGTIEFLVDKDLNFYFLEMNTRVQVEHPVTEFITGIDIVAEQIKIAAGFPLSFKQENITKKGHAIECRIYAEDPKNNFRPSPGKITLYQTLQNENIRIDTGITPQTEIKSSYDPMIAKLIVFADNRNNAIKKMSFALDNFYVQGIKNNIAFLKTLINSENFKQNKISVKFTEQNLNILNNCIEKEKQKFSVEELITPYLIYSIQPEKQNNIWQKIGFWRNTGTIAKFEINERTYSVEISDKNKNEISLLYDDNKQYKIPYRIFNKNTVTYEMPNKIIKAVCSTDKKGNGYISINGLTFEIKRKDILPEELSLSELMESTGIVGNIIKAPMPGRIIKIFVNQGQKVKKGEVLFILESMKMENNINAPKDGIIKTININEGEMVNTTKILIELE